MHWKVLTLSPDRFADACNRLQRLIEADGFNPDLVLSIRNGGLFVGNEMFSTVEHRDVLLQRKSTKNKSHLRRLIRMIPRALQDKLRIIEAIRLYKRSKHSATSDCLLSLVLPFSQSDFFHRILIVDDAVDRGTTLEKIFNAVSDRFPSADIRAAVITVTTPDPTIVPRYALYRDMTLIRFPWSIDA